MTRGHVRFPLLDGVRGLAIAAVLLYHVFLSIHPQTTLQYAVQKITAPLWIGVDIFFVLSSFLITGILIDTRKASNRFSSFYARRVLRIFPLYFATLAVIFLILPAFRLLPPTPFSDQVWFWTYLYNWGAAQGHQAFRLIHLWSLSVEEQFYLVWPLLLFAVPVRRLPTLFGVLLVCSLLFKLSVFLFGFPSRYIYYLTPAKLDDLCLGGLSAWIVRNPVWLAWSRAHILKLASLFTALFVTALVAGKGFESNKWPPLLFGTTGAAGLSALLMIDCVSHEGWRWWHIALGSAWLRWLGYYSYGIYVLHQAIFNFAADRLLGASLPVYTGSMALAAIASCIAAWVSFHLFENHFLRLKKMFRAQKQCSLS